jgi:hypothetical protein
MAYPLVSCQSSRRADEATAEDGRLKQEERATNLGAAGLRLPDASPSAPPLLVDAQELYPFLLLLGLLVAFLPRQPGGLQ